MKKQGFTLIELLIVVAIIGILAAVSTPHFIRKYGKAQAARAISDMRALSIALESYRIDQGAYPPDSSRPGVPIENYPWEEEYRSGIAGKLELMCLTSPVAYITTLPIDPFHSDHQYGAGRFNTYAYAANKGLWGEGPVAKAMVEGGKQYAMFSCGPDRDLDIDYFRLNPGSLSKEMVQQMREKKHWTIYDSSNGLRSSGDFPWLQGIGIPPL